MLIQGRGVEKDHDKGLAMLKAAAENGNPVAQNRLRARARLWRGGESRSGNGREVALLARERGISDGGLDVFLAGLSKEQRERAEASRATSGGRPR